MLPSRRGSAAQGGGPLLREPFVSGRLLAFSCQPVRGGRAAVRPPHGARLTEVKRDFRANIANGIGKQAPALHRAKAGETRFAGGSSALQAANSTGDTASITPPGRSRRNPLCGRELPHGGASFTALRSRCTILSHAGAGETVDSGWRPEAGRVLGDCRVRRALFPLPRKTRRKRPSHFIPAGAQPIPSLHRRSVLERRHMRRESLPFSLRRAKETASAAENCDRSCRHTIKCVLFICESGTPFLVVPASASADLFPAAEAGERHLCPLTTGAAGPEAVAASGSIPQHSPHRLGMKKTSGAGSRPTACAGFSARRMRAAPVRAWEAKPAMPQEKLL